MSTECSTSSWREIAEGELADEIAGAGLARHGVDPVGNRAGRARDRAAIRNQRVEILRQARKARLGAMQLPQFHEACVERRPGAAAERHRLVIAVGRDHETVDAHQRQPLERIPRCGPLAAKAIGDLAHFRQRPAANDVDRILRRPCRAFGHGHRVPQWRMRQLRGLHVDRDFGELIVLAREIDLVLRQRLHDDLIGLDIDRRRQIGVDAEIVQLMRRGAAADADLEPAMAQMIEHTDFFGEPQRMMRRQHIDQRAEADAFGALGDSGKEHARRRRQIERRRVMLAHVIGAKARAVISLDQREALVVLLGERIAPVVVLIEDAELQRGHGSPRNFVIGRARVPSRRGGARALAACRLGASPISIWQR